MIVKRLAPWIGFPLLATAVVLVGGWCALAVWFRFAASEPVPGGLAGAIVGLASLALAYLIVSFGFADDARLPFSIEARKERGEAYSTIAGFFRQYELAIVAADERDIVRVRSNVRGEDVRIYHLRIPAQYAQALLREY